MPTALLVVEHALSFVGVAEDPPNSNCNPFSHWLGRPCHFWCADAVVAWSLQCGVVLPPGTDTASTRANKAAWIKAGRWVEPADIQVGDHVFWHTSDRNGSDHSIPSHESLATGPPRSGRQPSVDGNTSADHDTGHATETGGVVAVKNRPVRYVIGAGRPDYTQENDDMYSDADRNRDIETHARVKNLEAVANRDIDTLKPILLEVLDHVKNDPGSGAGAGDVDPDAFVEALRDALVKGAG